EVGSPQPNDTVVTARYAHAAARQPKVSIMLESFANEGDAGTIDIDRFAHEKAVRDIAFKAGKDLYSNDGTNKKWNGIANTVDDSGSIGGLSRGTYAGLKANEDAAGSNQLSIPNIRTTYNKTRAAGMR